VDKSLDEAGSLSFLVRHTWLSMRSALEAELKAYDLSVAQYATLMIVHEHPGWSNADVGRAVASSRQAANQLLAGLEREGLILRSTNPDDRRTQQIALTDLGRRRFAEAQPAVVRREAELEAAFTDEQRQAVRAWLAGVSGACLGQETTGRKAPRG
jgi:DNA-binding MarR family transcriptional regulator